MDMDQLLQILACPRCHSDLSLVQNEAGQGFLCDKCQVIYPIRDGIPIMLIEQAIPAMEWQGEPCAS